MLAALDLKILSHLFSVIQHTIKPLERGGNKMRDIFRNLKHPNPTCASVLETAVRVLSIPQVQSALGLLDRNDLELKPAPPTSQSRRLGLR